MEKKIRNSIKLVLVLMLFIIPLISITSAEDLVCCEETNSGDFCQYVPEGDCASTNADPTSCDSTTYCQRGTCVDDEGGACTPEIRKATCENTPTGYWQPEDIDELYSCQKGCCLVGDNAEFVTQVECTHIATDAGVDVNFKSSITNEFECLDLSNSAAKGACVTNTDGRRGCTMEQKSSCLSNGGDFNEGYLCTAELLETDCAKSSKTRCGEDGRVYFLDSCGNYANVYDSTKFSKTDSEWTREMENYWEKIQEPTCSREEGNGINEDCGDCDRIAAGTICKEADRSNSPEFGDYVCSSLNCRDENGNLYRNGESWCANTPGTYYNNNLFQFGTGIHIDNANNSNIINEEVVEELEKGVNEYNLPGSQYVMLTCWDGEIIPEPCASYRNEYCAQSSISTIHTDNFRIAWCAENEWSECVLKDNKEDCLNPEKTCKWMEGYSFYFDEETGKPLNLRENDDMNKDIQGSCVPLIAPGFDFWKPESKTADICAMGSVVEPVLYEEWWGRIDSTAEGRYYEGEKGFVRENQCYDSCYAIPGYADDVSNIKSIHEGDSSVLSSISQRRGYYCVNSDGLPSKGSASGQVSCAGDPDDSGWWDVSSRREYPIFFNNQDWVNFLTTRTRSLGDCGYKESISGVHSEKELEIITAIFQKVKGSGEEKENVTEQQIIFKGNEYLSYEDWEQMQ